METFLYEENSKFGTLERQTPTFFVHVYEGKRDTPFTLLPYIFSSITAWGEGPFWRYRFCEYTRCYTSPVSPGTLCRSWCVRAQTRAQRIWTESPLRFCTQKLFFFWPCVYSPREYIPVNLAWFWRPEQHSGTRIHRPSLAQILLMLNRSVFFLREKSILWLF